MEPLQPHLETLVSVKLIHGSSNNNEEDENRAAKDLTTTTDNEEPTRRRSSSSSGKGDDTSTEEEIVKEDEERRRSNASSFCSVEVVDLELGIVAEKALHLSQSERDCRICHMSLDAANLESGVPIELGCSCKDDLAAAHKHCAETWFKIKGNKICEVCGSIAGNVVGIVEAETEETRNEVNHQALRTSGPRLSSEARSFWQGHRFLNFLLACMIFAFVISWLFHFNVPST